MEMGVGMNGISVIMPFDTDRKRLLDRTMLEYEANTVPSRVEFVLVSRTMKACEVANMRVIHYAYDHTPFCPAMALNHGVAAARYDNVLITCPEVMPQTDVLAQLAELPRGNYVCQVLDANPDGSINHSLINSGYRAETPGYYFLTMFRKEDIETLNGWDLEFMGGFAWEDTDFGERFVRAGFKHEMRDDIVGVHQYHERVSCSGPNFNRNRGVYLRNKRDGVVQCTRGLGQIHD